jgi:tripartite-type tricarboxylate transporter receptor subunit TctC
MEQQGDKMKAWNFMAAGALALAGLSAAAQTYPDKPIRIIVTYAPGGGADVQARLISKGLSEKLKQPIVVENRAGAGGNIGSAALAQSAPDGYTLLLATVATTVNPHLWAKAGYARKDYVGVAGLSSSPMLILAHPSFPATGVRELIEHVKANPGKVMYASGGAGAITQIEMELLKQSAGVEMQHVPYQGQAPAVQAVVGGQVPVMADSVASAMPLVKAGRLRALAITSKERSAAAPDLRTVVEQGYPELANAAWYGLVAPAGTPPRVLKVLSDAVREVLQQADTRKALEQVGAEAMYMETEQFNRFMDSEEAKWSQVVKKAGMRLD